MYVGMKKYRKHIRGRFPTKTPRMKKQSTPHPHTHIWAFLGRRDSTDSIFQVGGGGAVTCQNKKKYPTLSAATSGVGERGGRQLCVHEQFFGPGKRGEHSCVSSGSAISFENGACRSAKKQSWSITVIVSRPYVPATSAHHSNSQTRVLWGEMFNVYSWSDGDFFTKTLGISLGFSKQLGMQSS